MNKILNFIRSLISPRNPLLLLYHSLLAVFSSVCYGIPASGMTVIAVTGTSGKTTTAILIAEILKKAGKKTGLLSGSHFLIGDTKIVNETKLTTLSRFMLNAMLRNMARAGCEYLVIEVTSQALVQSRMWGIPVDVAVFTNLSPEHVEYHGGIEEYRAAKFLLFKKVRRAVVLNGDDENYDFFNRALAPRKLCFGLKEGNIHASDVRFFADKTSCSIILPDGGSIDVNLRLPSESNVYNVLAACAAATALEIKKEIIKSALELVASMPGRYEVVDCDVPFTIVVDYAHHPASLEKLFDFYRSVTRGRLIAVGGAPGGGRDRSKRPTMGEIVGRLCHYVIITDDDPYDEDRFEIINAVAAGVKNKVEGESFWKIPDRREAITFALKKLAREGDTVVIFGKGNEPVQVTSKGKIPWDDREVVREILEN